jgi:hypothetical protein
MQKSPEENELTKVRKSQILRNNIIKTINSSVEDSHYNRINADGALGQTDQSALDEMLCNVSDD